MANGTVLDENLGSFRMRRPSSDSIFAGLEASEKFKTDGDNITHVSMILQVLLIQ